MEANNSPGKVQDQNLTEALRAFDENRWDDAIRHFRLSLAADQENMDALAKFAFALSQTDQYEDAIKAIKVLIGKYPKQAKWPYMVGYQYYDRKMWKEALEWYDKSLILAPAYIKALYRKGYAHFILGQESEAESTFITCITTWEKTDSHGQDLDRNVYAKANFELGKLYLKKGLSLKARRYLKTAANLLPSDAFALYEFGQCYLRNKQFDDAIHELREADRLKPRTDYILDRLAQAYTGKGDLQGALRIYQEIPEFRRRDFVLQNLGTLYLSLGEIESALQTLTLASKKQKDNHNIQCALGKALEGTGKLQDARKAYARAIEIRQRLYSRDFPDAEESLGRVDALLAAAPPIPVSTAPEKEMGVIESYNDARGFGFISTDSKDRIFFHISEIPGGRIPRKGMRVSFSLTSSEKGFRAAGVELINVA